MNTRPLESVDGNEPTTHQAPMGLTQFLVIVSIGQLHENAYGAHIRRHLAKELRITIAPGQVSLAITRLEEHGYLKGIHRRTPGKKGRPPKLLTLTPLGETAKKKMYSFLKQVTAFVNITET